nr:HPr family phosphocarrier protein [Nanchangia anserum]
MAPDVVVRPCSCHDEGLARAIELLADACSAVASEIGTGAHIVILADFGPTKLAAHQLITQWGDGNVTLGRGPLVEGARAGAIAAAQGGDAATVVHAIAAAAESVSATDVPTPGTSAPEDDPYAPRIVTVVDAEGLKARPAAMLARLASDFDATISVNGADATSVLALMGLKVGCGDEIRIDADGPEARMALEALADAVGAGLTRTNN